LGDEIVVMVAAWWWQTRVGAERKEERY